VGRCSAVLLELLPGRTATELASGRPEVARAAGLACGRLHAQLPAIPAPRGLRLPPQAPASSLSRLLHLDLHPLNVLVSEDGVVTGVLDWCNAGGGDPVLDQARTWTILTLDPQARARRADPGFAALADGWLESGGLAEVPAVARAWACRFMLSDLAGRYRADQLRHVAGALAADEAAARTG
jgi:aminoglycoside phosphotransferase (APT) family kinase protein